MSAKTTSAFKYTELMFSICVGTSILPTKVLLYLLVVFDYNVNHTKMENCIFIDITFKLRLIMTITMSVINWKMKIYSQNKMSVDKHWDITPPVHDEID